MRKMYNPVGRSVFPGWHVFWHVPCLEDSVGKVVKTMQSSSSRVLLPVVLLLSCLSAGACNVSYRSGAMDPDSVTCMQPQCHGAIERIHFGGAELGCASCHGGDPTDPTREGAHVTVSQSFNPSVPDAEVLEHLSVSELDELDEDVLRFLNPGDYRVAHKTCGSSTLRGGDCHPRATNDSLLSTHATLSGQLAGGVWFIGAGPRESRYAPRDVEDPFGNGGRAGAVPSLAQLPRERPPGPAANEAIADAFFPLLRRDCAGMCHLYRDGPKEAGLYHSSGCSACHMISTPDTRPVSQDPTQLRYEPGHVGRHQLTNLVPDSQCATCHHFHLSRSLLFMGVRERSGYEGDWELMATLGEDRVNYGTAEPDGVVPWGKDSYARWHGGHKIYDKPWPFYIEKEDEAAEVDSTPPSIHFEKGMACIDCHTMIELHGSGPIYDSRVYEIRTRCETCHGHARLTQERNAVIDPDQIPISQAVTRPLTRSPNPDVVTYDSETDTFLQRLRFSGEQRPLTQIARRIDTQDKRHNPFTLMGCALHAGSKALRAELLERVKATPPDERDEAFPGLPEGGTLPEDLGERRGRLECFACHNAWTVNCYGCHMIRDDRGSMMDPVGGGEVPLLYKFAMSTVSDALALGFNARGRISPMVGTNVFVSHVKEDGSRPIDAQPLATVDGFSGDGHAHSPVNHHTVRKRPRPCEACHPRADQPARDKATEKLLRRAVGFGTGDYTFKDGNGRVHVLDRILRVDYDGDGAWEHPLEGAGLLPAAVTAVESAAGTPHGRQLLPNGEAVAPDEPPPGPLDLATVNRMLGNPVVPQVFPE